MSTNVTVIQALGMNCPKGGDFYICDGAQKEFFGCCKTDPCAGDVGKCPQNDLRTASFDPDYYDIFPMQKCGDTKTDAHEASVDAYFYSCAFIAPPFIGCCKSNACASGDANGCPEHDVVPMMLATVASQRQAFLNPGGVILSNGSATIYTSTPKPTNATNLHGGPGTDLGSLSTTEVAGITTGVTLLTLIVLGLLWRIWWISRRGFRSTIVSPESLSSRLCFQPGQSYTPVSRDIPTEITAKSSQNNSIVMAESSSEITTVVPAQWYGGPRELHPRNLSWYMEWVWEIFLTLTPITFIVMSVLILRLDGQLRSDDGGSAHGERIRNMTRLSPTIYPIIFAAISSRFYKNFARWRLEQPRGIGLGALEQIFGSQSFAGAFERLLFVRTHLLIGIAILLAWAMSPLGGQGTARMLVFGNSSTSTNGTIYYVHPSYQFSYNGPGSYAKNAKTSVDTLYATNLMSSQSQKYSARDLWDLPRIPQWPTGIAKDTVYNIDQEALSRGEAYYVSLLGIRTQGLNFASGNTRYNFSIETPYVDFNCRLIGSKIDPKHYTRYISAAELNLTRLFDETSEDFSSFAVNISGPGAWGTWGRPDDIQPLHLLYASLRQDGKDYYIIFNCTMQTLVLQTETRCEQNSSSISCSARRQRLVSNPIAADSLLWKAFRSPDVLESVLKSWRQAAGSVSSEMASPTDNYLAGDAYPYAGQIWRSWDGINESSFSNRLTTAFNTYYFATIDPFSHNTVSLSSGTTTRKMATQLLNSEPFLNATDAVATTTHQVYRVNRFWVTVVLITTFILEMLAIIGLGLRIVIHGPDVLGFASSMTRENPYVPLPPGGSGLDGPDRAKMLREIRVQLADVRPNEEIGYVALKAVSKEDNEIASSRRPFVRKRLYM